MTPASLTTRFDDALAYARMVHAEQVRKGTSIPYISHLLAVASLVLEGDGDEDEVIAGLLHDAPEDHGGEVRLAEIQALFGERVALICRACSDALPEADDEKAPWRVRKEEHLAHLEQTENRSVLLVTVADKLHNSRCVLQDYRLLGPDLWTRFRGGRDGTIWYYRRVTDLLLRRLDHLPISVELDDTVRRLEELVAEREG